MGDVENEGSPNVGGSLWLWFREAQDTHSPCGAVLVLDKIRPDVDVEFGVLYDLGAAGARIVGAPAIFLDTIILLAGVPDVCLGGKRRG